MGLISWLERTANSTAAAQDRKQLGGKSEEWKPSFQQYIEAVTRRMRCGHREYGDRSFSAEPLQLIREVQEELEDVCGWSFVLWHRLEAAKRALQGVQLPARAEEIEL